MPICRLFCVALIVVLAGCQSQPPQQGPVKPREFTLSDMAKGDVDMVAEVSFRQSIQYLRELAGKLYRRNPDQLRRAAGGPLPIEQALSRLFEQRQDGGSRANGAALIGLAFNDEFAGDRVAAFVGGLRDMLHHAYGGDGEFFMPHEYDPQKIYHLARNFEIASWRLRNKHSAAGGLYLLSTGADEHGVTNIGFERLFGKLIGLQDHFAHVVADTTSRRIKNVFQSVASAVFFPL